MFDFDLDFNVYLFLEEGEVVQLNNVMVRDFC